ncbi:MAG TPA: aromatic ring-hydroxylating dioxygenase subunit alpha [Acidimicrobiales bacterium]|nr:aromatic ring-hydroxylating dioxygenase subunit alpha [Acidimicrobiales bacterium]
MNEGTAYGRPEPTYDRDLVEVGPGTPGGELLRRYWQPVARSEEATEIPSRVRALGEDLILFRDRSGRPGLLYPRCCHRGTTLYYGKVEDEGIRCCYHGWLFATDGTCVDQPCEPDRGRNRERYRQPWYPVQEYHGLIFAYMGPPDRQPVFPRYDIFDDLGEDEEIVIIDHFAFGGPVEAPCNWFQTHENSMDPYHVFVLHTTLSGIQFNEALEIWPRISFRAEPWGMVAHQDRDLPDGKVLHRVTELRLPNMRVIPTPTLSVLGRTNNLSWALPIDDTHTKVYAMLRKKKDRPPQGLPVYGPGKTWFDLTEEEHQLYPGDYEAQVGQGPITLHSEERLSSTDRGVSMVRRQYREQMEIVAAGGDPAGVFFDESEAVVSVVAGNYIVDPSELED